MTQRWFKRLNERNLSRRKKKIRSDRKKNIIIFSFNKRNKEKLELAAVLNAQRRAETGGDLTEEVDISHVIILFEIANATIQKHLKIDRLDQKPNGR
ncbi:hypothetical protein DICVIV_05270, partial [Dictyocaulus viviparus]